jgi:hypothetical protein
MPRNRFSVAGLILSALLLALMAVPAFADSQVRIVRLSDLNGDVLIDRGAGQGFERALLNMPIVQGTKLWTKSDDARTEVELEDGTTVRLAPHSQVSFPQLSLRDSGVKASTVLVGEGTVYFNVSKDKVSEFQVHFGQQQVTVPKSASFRVDASPEQVKLAVLKGDVDVQGASGTVKVTKEKTATFDAAKDTATVAKGVDPEPLDEWNKNESQYQKQYASAGSPYNAPFSYGFSDLNYYGNYYYVAPYGWMWQPTGLGAAWNPYFNGAWAYYPGFGYSWVSMYPWGWLPYRYGAWAYVPGFGWGWQPGAYWNGWLSSPVLINPPAGFVAPRVPMGGTRTVLLNPPSPNHPGTILPNERTVRPGVVNDRGNLPVARNTRPVGTTTNAKAPVPVRGTAPAPIHGGTPALVHGTTMRHGMAAPRPGSPRGSFGGVAPSGGFGTTGGLGASGGFGHVGSSSSSGHTSSPPSSGSHPSPK